LTAPPQAEVGSLKALEPVLQAVAAAGATQVQVQRTTLVEARRRVLAVLDRVMTINHVDDPNFAVLLEAQAKAREIRAAVLDPKGPTAESAAAIMQSTPVFSALLTLIEGRDRLDAEKCAVLEDSVTRLFGPALTLAVTRGKLVAGGAGGSAPPRARPAAPPKGFEGTGQPAATAPAQRFAPPASSPASPFTPPPAPAPAMQEVAAAPPAPQDAGAAETVDTAALDDGAQWWVSPWARWTSAKGTIDFNAAVKQELSKYAYLLSVPIQQAADYEDARFHPPERAGRRSGPQLATPHAGPAAVRRSPVRRDAAVADRAVLRGGRGPQRTARDRREADGGPRRFRRCVAPDDTARG